jgi:hypothetical protein
LRSGGTARIGLFKTLGHAVELFHAVAEGLLLLLCAFPLGRGRTLYGRPSMTASRNGIAAAQDGLAKSVPDSPQGRPARQRGA